MRCPNPLSTRWVVHVALIAALAAAAAGAPLDPIAGGSKTTKESAFSIEPEASTFLLDDHTAKLSESFGVVERFGETAVLGVDCGEMLAEELRMLEDLKSGRMSPESAAQRRARLGDPSECDEPLPEVGLFDGLVLPEVRGGHPFAVVMNPPGSVPQGFQARIIAAQGDFREASLYGGSVVLSQDGTQLLLATQPTFDLPRCARTEQFTLELSWSGGSQVFEVTQPVRLEAKGVQAQLRPGQSVDLPVCTAGNRTPVAWQLDPLGNPQGLPPGLAFSPTSDGNARIHGTVQTASHSYSGSAQAMQDGQSDEDAIELIVAAHYYPTIGDACGGRIEVEPGVPFRCELPRPIGYATHVWSLTGTSPAATALMAHGHVEIVPQGARFFVEGELPSSVSLGTPLGPFSSTVGSHFFELSVTGDGVPLHDRPFRIDAVVPFKLWTQNTILRPNNPFVPNTGDDNEERADLLLRHVGKYDIVALQEVFDDDQRRQISRGATDQGFRVSLGANDEDSCWYSLGLATCTEDDGLVLLSRDASRTLHFARVFETECEGSDCRANKGFSATLLGKRGAAIWVVNTHTQSADGTPGAHADVRQGQIREIVDFMAAFDDKHPVVLLGDLNVIAGSGEYHARMAGELKQYVDPIVLTGGAVERPFTIDKGRNAYAHFWEGSHLLEHLVEHAVETLGSSACAALSQAIAGRAGCILPVDHPSDQERLDYVLIKQGSEFTVEIDALRLVDPAVSTEMCRDDFHLALHPEIDCALSDHYGLEAEIRVIGPPR